MRSVVLSRRIRARARIGPEAARIHVSATDSLITAASCSA